MYVDILAGVFEEAGIAILAALGVATVLALTVVAMKWGTPLVVRFFQRVAMKREAMRDYRGW